MTRIPAVGAGASTPAAAASEGTPSASSAGPSASRRLTHEQRAESDADLVNPAHLQVHFYARHNYNYL